MLKETISWEIKAVKSDVRQTLMRRKDFNRYEYGLRGNWSRHFYALPSFYEIKLNIFHKTTKSDEKSFYILIHIVHAVNLTAHKSKQTHLLHKIYKNKK